MGKRYKRSIFGACSAHPTRLPLYKPERSGGKSKRISRSPSDQQASITRQPPDGAGLARHEPCQAQAWKAAMRRRRERKGRAKRARNEPPGGREALFYTL